MVVSAAWGNHTNFPSGKRRCSSVVASRKATKHGSRRSIVANKPSFHNKCFHASRTKVERRARKFIHVATSIASGGREDVCTQNSASQSLIWRRVDPHSLRLFHSSGGGETMLAPG